MHVRAELTVRMRIHMTKCEMLKKRINGGSHAVLRGQRKVVQTTHRIDF
jgi:hypothetical protein